MGVRTTQAGDPRLGVAIGVASVSHCGHPLSMSIGPSVAAAPSRPRRRRPSPAPRRSPSARAASPAAACHVAMAALSGTAVVNGRITVDAATLRTTLSSRASTSDIARALRSLAADAALGSDLTGRLARWPDAGPVAAQLDAFYRSMAKTARDGPALLAVRQRLLPIHRRRDAQGAHRPAGRRRGVAHARRDGQPRAAAGRPARAVVAAGRGMRPSAGAVRGRRSTEAA